MSCWVENSDKTADLVGGLVVLYYAGKSLKIALFVRFWRDWRWLSSVWIVKWISAALVAIKEGKPIVMQFFVFCALLYHVRLTSLYNVQQAT